jgi:putative aldouronate transport system permease protein
MTTLRVRRGFLENLRRYRLLYLMLLPALLLLFLFSYVPMYGVVVAFQDYKVMKGIMASRWVGLENFITLFHKQSFLQALRNTFAISGLRLLLGFPAPILFALLLNELGSGRFKKTVQTISYMPYFVSWVVISGMMLEVFSLQRGIVNTVIRAFGGTSIYFMNDPGWFLGILIGSGIWQSVGWGSIIYLGAIAGINPELYESASIDGASRLQKARFITMPGMYPMIVISFLLSLGGILNAGFDQIFNMYSPGVFNVSDILDTYMYRAAFTGSGVSYGASDLSIATAVGLFKNAIGFGLLFGANAVAGKLTDYTFW